MKPLCHCTHGYKSHRCPKDYSFQSKGIGRYIPVKRHCKYCDCKEYRPVAERRWERVEETKTETEGEDLDGIQPTTGGA